MREEVQNGRNKRSRQYKETIIIETEHIPTELSPLRPSTGQCEPRVPLACPEFLTPRVQDTSPRTAMADWDLKFCKICSGIVVVVMVVILSIFLSPLHRIDEGNVGVYYKYGAIMDTVTHPGIHYMTPFVVDVFEKPAPFFEREKFGKFGF